MAWAQQSSSRAWSASAAQPSQSTPNAATPSRSNYPHPPGRSTPMHDPEPQLPMRPSDPHPQWTYPESPFYCCGRPLRDCGCGPQVDPNRSDCCRDPSLPPGCITGCCDYATLLVFCFAVMSVVGFGWVLGDRDLSGSPDDVFSAMSIYSDERNTLQLQLAIAPNVVLFANGTEPNISSSCVRSGRLTGSFGRLCMDDSFSAAIFVLNISRWVNFRATLYFIAMMGTLIIAVLLFVVHRQRFPDPRCSALCCAPMPTFSPPIAFYGTPLYHVFRVVWTAVGFVVFFWICTEMYQYWWFIGYYQNATRGRLRDFWIAFDKKHVTAVVFVGVYLCWPLCNLILEMVFWLLLIIPWFGYRAMCSPGLESTRMPPETELQDIPFCIRVDMFFTECHQGTRVGFSTKLWQMVTGSREPWLDFCSQAPGGAPPGGWQGGQPPGQWQGGPPPPTGPPPPQASAPPQWAPPPRPGSMGQEMRPVQASGPPASSFDNSRTIPPAGAMSSSTTTPAGSTPTRVTGSGNFGQVQVSQSWGGPEMSQSVSVPETPSKKRKKDKHSHSHAEGETSDEERKKKKKEKKKDKS